MQLIVFNYISIFTYNPKILTISETAQQSLAGDNIDYIYPECSKLKQLWNTSTQNKYQ